MSNTKINIAKNGTTTLATAGKYCDRNIDINVDVGVNSKEVGLLMDGYLQNFHNEHATSVKMFFFYKNYSLKSVNLPKVKIVYDEGFNSCTSLVDVYMPKLHTLKIGSFKHCWKLEKIELPSATSIASEVFYGSKVLKTFVVGTTNCTLVSKNAFLNTPIGNGEGYIYVPDDAVEAYKTATNWCAYADQIKGISELPQG